MVLRLRLLVPSVPTTLSEFTQRTAMVMPDRLVVPRTVMVILPPLELEVTSRAVAGPLLDGRKARAAVDALPLLVALLLEPPNVA